MKKYILTTLLAATCSLCAMSQSGSVTVRMDAAANSAINSAQAHEKVSGYRVCIFSDNAQTGRAAAHTAVAQLHSIVPGVSANVVYENPFFKAYAGYCLNKIEATRLLGRLRAAFPRAIIVGENFAVSNFSNAYHDVVSIDDADADSTSVEPTL